MANEVTITVMGEPITEGSMHGIPFHKKGKQMGCNIVHNNDVELKAYRKAIANIADKYHDELFTDNKDMPYAVSMVFFIPKGKSVKRKYPTVRGTKDLDKVCRAVLDALTQNIEKYRIKGVMSDDAAVIHIKATKFYVNAQYPEPQTIIRIKRVLLSSEFSDIEECLNIEDYL